MQPLKHHFSSDNTAGICPEAWEAILAANTGFEASYGADHYTQQTCAAFREFFETNCEIYFVFNGTAANSLALASLCQSYHSAITHETSHVETDECGAPEFFSNGTKLLLGSGEHGKLTPQVVQTLITKRQDIHYPRPHALSISQPTELGTIYRKDEIHELCAVAKFHGLKVHMDGARFLHALTATGYSPKELTWEVGVDVLCLGGTKAGIGTSEAVIFFDKALAADFDYRCKQAGQLASKMRYLSVPWLPLLKNESFKKYSQSAMNHAQRLAAEATRLPGIQLLYPREANSVFLRLPEALNRSLQDRGWRYYHFIGGGARFMCSWQTTDEHIQSLLEDMKECVDVA